MKRKKKHDWRKMCEILQLRTSGKCERCGHEIGLVEPGNCHHIKPRGRGGKDTADNLMCLCNWPKVPIQKFGAGYPGCHSWVHQNPKESKEKGWLK